MIDFKSASKMISGLALCLVLGGLWQLQKNGGTASLSPNDWSLLPSNHSIGGVRSAPQGRDLDLSSRDVVLKRSELIESEESGEAAEKKKADQAAAKKEEKKKETAKKEDKKKPVAKKKKNNKAQPEEEKTDSLADNKDEPAASGGAIPSWGRAHKNTGNGIHADEWRQRLLTTADPTQTGQFIQAYLSGEVSKEVFYLITEEMIQDSRPLMQEMARQILEATPSFDSFKLLAQYEPILAEPMRSRFFNALDVYSKHEYIDVLELALQSDEESVVYHAAELVRIAADQMLQNVLSSSGGPREVRGFRSIATADDYARLLPLLRDISNTGSGTLAEIASQAFDQLTRVINT